MARGKGTANLAASLEVLAGAPLDARLVCPTVADLYIASNWPYKYIGMKTTVQSTGDTYRLVNLDVTQESSWVKEGATEYDDFTGATSQAAGVHGLVPAPAIADMEKFLKGDGTWGVVPMPSLDYSNTSPDAMNFSTDEKVIGTWVDGKPLYQKVISTTLPEVTTDGQNNSKLVSIGASIDVGFIAAAFFKTINNNYNPIVFVSSAMNRMVNAVVYPNDGIAYQNALNMNCNSIGYSEEPVCFIVRYTKTTDSPVASGEKIVGQWIDGKPLYEKTGTFTSADYESGTTTWQYFDLLSLPDMITVVDVSGFISTPSYGVAPIGSKNQIDNSRYWDSCFNYKKIIVFNNYVGSSLSESINITVRYTKAS